MNGEELSEGREPVTIGEVVAELIERLPNPSGEGVVDGDSGNREQGKRPKLLIYAPKRNGLHRGFSAARLCAGGSISSADHAAALRAHDFAISSIEDGASRRLIGLRGTPCPHSAQVR